MKKLVIPIGGHDTFIIDDLNHLNDAIQEGTGGLASMHASSTYLTDTWVQDVSGYHNCSSGYMVYKGEVCAFDAQHVANVAGQTLYWVPDISSRTPDPIIYANGTPNSPHVVKKVKLQFAAAPPADSVAESAMQRAYKGDWVSIVPINGWTVSTDAAYRMNGNKLEFRGKLDATAATAATFFQLPVGFRPSRDIALACGSAAATFGAGAIQVSTTGDMDGDQTWNTIHGWFYLDGLSFYLV